jgi:hypothetical protein
VRKQVVRRRKRKSHTAPPRTHALDHRVDSIGMGAGDDDDLLNTKEVASWFGVSEEWLEIGRSIGYGPPFILLAPRIVRYQRGQCRDYLKARRHASTSEYRQRA